MSKKPTALGSFFVKGKGPLRRQKAAFNRQYQESYLIPPHQARRLSNEAFKPASPPGDQAPGVKSLWKREQEAQKLRATTSTDALRASYLVVNRIAKKPL